jgi:hypothetical protein
VFVCELVCVCVCEEEEEEEDEPLMNHFAWCSYFSVHKSSNFFASFDPSRTATIDLALRLGMMTILLSLSLSLTNFVVYYRVCVCVVRSVW